MENDGGLWGCTWLACDTILLNADERETLRVKDLILSGMCVCCFRYNLSCGRAHSAGWMYKRKTRQLISVLCTYKYSLRGLVCSYCYGYCRGVG